MRSQLNADHDSVGLLTSVRERGAGDLLTTRPDERVHPMARGCRPHGRVDARPLPPPPRRQAAPQAERHAVHAAVLSRHDPVASSRDRRTTQARHRPLARDKNAKGRGPFGHRASTAARSHPHPNLTRRNARSWPVPAIPCINQLYGSRSPALVVRFKNRQHPTGTRRVHQREHARSRAGTRDTRRRIDLQDKRDR